LTAIAEGAQKEKQKKKGGVVMESAKFALQQGLWTIVIMVLIALGAVCLIKEIKTFMQSINQ
jgi:hypothetical protein